MKPHAASPASLPWAHLRLPPFPQIALQVLQLAHSEDVPLQQLCDLISTDPAFASEVLTVANSILYAPRYPSSSILQAVTVLGERTLQGMCLAVGVRAYLGKTISHPAMRLIWRHNLACAVIADQLAAIGLVDKDVAFTAGILHDLGRVALSVVQPRAYAHLLETYRGPAGGILEPERALFGMDHSETGLQLISDWQLPADFEPVVFAHHAGRRSDRAWSLTELIKMSCSMADACGFAAFCGCEAPAYEALLAELPARERRLFTPDVAALSANIAARIASLEAA